MRNEIKIAQIYKILCKNKSECIMQNTISCIPYITSKIIR